MRIIFTLIITMILTTYLLGRTNPFEETETFIEQQNILLKKIEEKENKLKEDRLRLEKERLNFEREKLELAKEQERLRLEKERKAKILKEKLAALEIKKKEEKKKVIANNIKYYKIYSFIKANTNNNILTIDIDDKYKLINQDLNHKSRKFIFDFSGTINMYTKRVLLKNSPFKSITIGTHKKENFFRVVVALNDKLKYYQEDMDIDNSIIKIEKIK
ncbi:MAG: AMIN domain-containing protein [Campylobacterota bacterium]|nr:AMIN domain-containing protein [Campylobacterota bacterium]